MNSFLKKYSGYSRNFYALLKNYSTQSLHPMQKKLETLFINKDVQKILKKITGLDHEKIFAPSKTELESPKYEFVTEKRLSELQTLAIAKALQKLQMPPVMDIREPINEILAKDPELQGYLQYKTVFTDISPDVSSRERVITVREVDGTLRKATWEERERMNQIFFPIPGRNLETPKLFESPHLERLLDEGSYEFVLDCACIQFEPDAPEYHRVTNQTYEHVQLTKKFDLLRSTRHFGPMVFYFTHKKNIDQLLIDMISRHLISDASDTVRLFYLIHSELDTTKDIHKTDEIEILQNYIRNHSSQKDGLEFALQTILDHKKSDLQI
ncbi:28S ribosomal protein S22, mitochondrial-like [Argiope bruennichi]|uniref:28S ribosomal protein S22, mitochondrial-like n=1 Tax=Argiope bruennichi TaxID=94029 RepID=UPI0024955C5D|nr:28S ribosomal protein S22, mitochondrial-like [Argiope bruennichi]